jgi:DNA integrity scanning protein DisA with diadenylate cyclase activity
MVLEKAPPTTHPTPVLLIDSPEIDNRTVTMHGAAAPGSANVTIGGILWDWGDNQQPEYHVFPHSHVYDRNGTYIVSVTALQSDGQEATETRNITIDPGTPRTSPTLRNQSFSGLPGGQPDSPPILTLLEPVIDGRNVTLNGNLNPASPGQTIESVQVDWDDGTTTTAKDLPVSHLYENRDVYTISVTGNQSDGLSTTKRITLDLKQQSPGVPVPPDGGGPPGADPTLLIVIIVTAVVVVVIAALVQRVMIKRALRRITPSQIQGLKKVFTPRRAPLTITTLSTEELERICTNTDVSADVLGAVIQVSREIAVEGREGKAIGTSFIVGDTGNVLQNSKQFVLNPFQGHDETTRLVTDSGTRGTVKEFAQLDGAFIITGAGVVEAAGRCITVDMSQVELPGGLGSRHSSVAGITRVTKSIGVVVSQSGLITVFRDGKIVYPRAE